MNANPLLETARAFVIVRTRKEDGKKFYYAGTWPAGNLWAESLDAADVVSFQTIAYAERRLTALLHPDGKYWGDDLRVGGLTGEAKATK